MCKKTIKFRSYRTKCLVRPYKNNWYELGFSLVELLFTITLISILLTLAFPVYKHLALELRLFILTEQVRSTLDYARSEAIRHQSVITICKSKDGKNCSGRWKDGWIVLINKSSSSIKNGSLLFVYPALSYWGFLEWHGFRSDNYLQLYPNGSSQNGSFIVCVNAFSQKIARLIKISQTGRIRIDRENTRNLKCNG
jgi:type IV fimbrial biogenesis protein FimT